MVIALPFTELTRHILQYIKFSRKNIQILHMLIGVPRDTGLLPYRCICYLGILWWPQFDFPRKSCKYILLAMLRTMSLWEKWLLFGTFPEKYLKICHICFYRFRPSTKLIPGFLSRSCGKNSVNVKIPWPFTILAIPRRLRNCYFPDRLDSANHCSLSRRSYLGWRNVGQNL